MGACGGSEALWLSLSIRADDIRPAPPAAGRTARPLVTATIIGGSSAWRDHCFVHRLGRLHPKSRRAVAADAQGTRALLGASMPSSRRIWHNRQGGRGMLYATEHNLTDLVIERWGSTPDPRLREVVTALVKHLHAF